MAELGMNESDILWVLQSTTATMQCNRGGRPSLMAFVCPEEIPEIEGFRSVKTTVSESAQLATQMGLRSVTICLRKESDGTIPTKILSLHRM
jgi:hypothetical protein